MRGSPQISSAWKRFRIATGAMAFRSPLTSGQAIKIKAILGNTPTFIGLAILVGVPEGAESVTCQYFADGAQNLASRSGRLQEEALH